MGKEIKYAELKKAMREVVLDALQFERARRDARAPILIDRNSATIWHREDLGSSYGVYGDPAVEYIDYTGWSTLGHGIYPMQSPNSKVVEATNHAAMLLRDWGWEVIGQPTAD